MTFDGEQVLDVEPVFGYLHRGTEKLAEERTYTQVVRQLFDGVGGLREGGGGAVQIFRFHPGDAQEVGGDGRPPRRGEPLEQLGGAARIPGGTSG